MYQKHDKVIIEIKMKKLEMTIFKVLMKTEADFIKSGVYPSKPKMLINITSLAGKSISESKLNKKLEALEKEGYVKKKIVQARTTDSPYKDDIIIYVLTDEGYRCLGGGRDPRWHRDNKYPLGSGGKIS